MTSTIQGPGILFVRSRISPASKQVLDEPTFLKWYDDLHIPEVVSTSGIKSAFRYIDMHKTCPASPKPYLAFYPMLDLAFTLSEEFRGVRVESETLPGSGVVYDLADFDVSYLGFCGATMPKRGHGRAEYIVTAGIRPGNDADMESLDKFFEEQTTAIAKAQGYIRTLRFKLLYARTNAQSRALKGLPTTEEPHPEPSTWVAIHEFGRVPAEGVVEDVREGVKGDTWGNTESEVLVWKLDAVHGEGKFFEG